MSGRRIAAEGAEEWEHATPVLAHRTRRAFLFDLRSLLPVLAALGGAQAVARTFHAIQDVGQWWP